MIDQDTMERRVVTALRAKADGLVPRDLPFEGRPPLTIAPTRPRRRRRLAWSMVAVAAAACIALALAVTSGRGRPHTDLVTTPAPATTAVPVPLGYAPTWVPPGLDPVSITATRGSTAAAMTDQLFGSADGQPELFVDLQPASGGGGSGTAVTVRGQPGQAAPAKEFADSSTTLTWQEGATVQATFRGMSLAQAQALLATLAWAAPDDHLAGFVPAAGSPLQLLGQVVDSAPTPPVTSLDLAYADRLTSQAPGQGLQLDVRTTTATGALTADYLKAWFHGTRGADGGVESFDPAFNTLSRAWPDGHSTWIDANATAVSEADEQRVADSLQLITTADFALREDQVAASIARDLPVVASTDLPAGTMELRGDSTTQALCLQPVGRAAAICTSPTATEVGGVAGGSVLVDGQWWVLGAGKGLLSVLPPGGEPHPGSTSVPAIVIPTQTATAAGWTFVIASPPPGLDSVSVWSGNQGTGAYRPVA